ncbi:endonuclease V-like [Centruroides sculpturatus]|uniref:endonuclease V-like n=1 Tax=Centruroides sculpturatus TaxID=218467 RepID=UPI000C6C9A17|nr:endonuclease V-like [Centruroides sculpturatus]
MMDIEEKATKYGVSSTLLHDWNKEQIELKKKIILSDSEEWQKSKDAIESEENCTKATLQYVAGVDISYRKDHEQEACTACVVCSLPDLEVVYEDLEIVNVTTPYVPGFLAFREVSFLQNAVEKIKSSHPEYVPQVVLVDGNGILHPNGFGAACHLGVLLDIPCIGVAKNLFFLDNIVRDEDYHNKVLSLKEVGDFFPLYENSGRKVGVALKTSKPNTNPVIVSVGHRCTIDTAIWTVLRCSKYRIPEPLRQADIRSREFLRIHNC